MKRKQKGRNQDINVKDMNNYRELKNKKEEHSKKLEEINGKNDQLKEKSENIKEIIDNLKPASFNKNNKVISNEELEKIKDFTDNVTNVIGEMKSANDLNILIEDYENNYDKLETENKILKQKSQFQEEKINELNNEISIKDRIINELKNQINNLESTVYKLKGFWNAIINRFKYMIFDEKMEKETIIVIQK